MDSAFVFVSLGLQRNCQGEGGAAQQEQARRDTCRQPGLFSHLQILCSCLAWSHNTRPCWWERRIERCGQGWCGGCWQWLGGSCASLPGCRSVLSKGRREELEAASLQQASQFDYSRVYRLPHLRSALQEQDWCLRTVALLMAQQGTDSPWDSARGTGEAARVLLAHGSDDKPASEAARLRIVSPAWVLR